MFLASLKPLNALPLLGLLCFATPVHAADPLSLNPDSPWYASGFETGWHFELGGGPEYEPTYAGSDKYISGLAISARALYRTSGGHRYYVSLGELGATFQLSQNMQLLAFLEYEEGREDEEDSTLTGLDTIDATVEGQFMLARRMGSMTFYGVLQPDLTGDANKGLVWFIGAGYDRLSADERWRTSTTFDLSGADSEYMHTEFGITAEESQRTGYAIYQPGSGLKSLTWNVSREYYFSDRFSLLGSMDMEYYLSDAADSPLIADEGSELTFEASLQLRYRF